MALSIFGLLILGIGAVLIVWGTSAALLAFVMGASLMGGSAAILLPALGGSSIPPAVLAAMLLLVRILLQNGQHPGMLGKAVADNGWLVLFAVYGVISALTLPHVFAGAVNVMPLRPIISKDPFVTYPLAFSAQNITVAVYLTMTMVAGLCAAVAVRQAGAERVVARAAACVAATHALLGFGSVAAAGTPARAFFDVFRNGNYAQLEQEMSGLVRMAGIFPEPSGYANYGLIWLFFTAELWFRRCEPRWTGPAALLILVALLASTSSTAYLGIGAYAAVLVARKMMFPAFLPLGVVIAVAGAALSVIIGVIVFRLADPDQFARIVGILERLTLDKSDSLSGQQRLMWALQGWQSFVVSGGLGVGAGSFRSSSLVMAILGSVGVIGLTAFLFHLARVLKPLRRSTYVEQPDERLMIGAAASWAAALMLIPASVTAPSPDPGLVWGLLGGIALGLRNHPALAPIASRAATPRPYALERLA